MKRETNVKTRGNGLWISAIIIIIVTILMSSVSSVFLNPAFLFTAPTTEVLTAAQAVINENNSQDDLVAVYDKEQINIVLLGFDRTESKAGEQNLFRPDTIIIATLNFKTAEVSLISIPRDSYVRINGSNVYDKINHAYSHGYFRAGAGEDPHKSGLQTTLRTIENFLGAVPLHEYVVLDIDGAAAIFDTIGGIHYDVESDIRARAGEGRLLLEKGYQHLNGKQLMDYLRNRASRDGGELGRVARQQEMLILLFEKIKQEGRLRDIPALYSAINQAFETELNLVQFVSLAAFALRVDFAEIETYTFGGKGQLSYRDGEGQNIWYWVIDEEKRVETIRDVFGLSVGKNSAVYLPGPYYPEPEEEYEEYEEEFEEYEIEFDAEAEQASPEEDLPDDGEAEIGLL